MNGEELRAIREEVGLTQLAQERATGISRTYISLYENSRMVPTQEHQDRLREVLIDANYLPALDEPFGDDSCGERASCGESGAIRERIYIALQEAPEGQRLLDQ
jgi:transcriptional regulator with XRE-family HTH domain